MPRFDNLEGWLAWQETLHFTEIDLGLVRISAVLDQLGNKDQLPTCITIAGTNGKGSTAAFTAAMLRASNKRVGVFSSPHLVRYNERISINNECVSDEQLCSAFKLIDANRGDISLTYFEFSALAALTIFAQSNLDYMILEVGLGGRLDAVNVIDADVAIISNIALDHESWLGDTVEKIAVEKLGICRANKPAIWSSPNAVPATVQPYLNQNHIPMSYRERDFFLIREGDNTLWKNEQNQLDVSALNAMPLHIQDNAAGALSALWALDPSLLTEQAVEQAAKGAIVTGRCQIVQRGNPTVVVDVAHNENGAIALADWLETRFPDHEIVGVFGCLLRKKPQALLRATQSVFSEFWLVGLKNTESWSPDDLKEAAIQLQLTQPVYTFNSVDEAIAYMPKDNRVYVYWGSFYTVAEYLEHHTQLEAG